MRKLAGAVALGLGCSLVLMSVAHGQGRGGGSWSTAGGDPQLTGWQTSEHQLTRDDAKDIKFLWKIKLGSNQVTEPTEPLFGGHTITNYGFKDMALVLGPDNKLTNVDYQLGTILWQRQVEPLSGHGAPPCPAANLASYVIQPTPSFGGGRGRGAAGGRGAAEGRGAEAGGRAALAAAMPSGPPPNPPVTTPRVGGNLASGVGFGGLRGIFVITADGNLHEQELTNGWDYGTPVKFTPAGADLGAPTIDGSTIYATVGGRCGGSANGAYALDMATDAYKAASFDTGNIAITGTDGPAVSTDSKTLYVTTGSGSGSGDAHANSVVALDAKTMQVKDYYTPSGAEGKTNINVSPVVFAYKDHDYVAAYVAGGRLALMDADSLGGADHHTPLAVTPVLSKNGADGAWGRLATAEDTNGTRFICVSINGPFAVDAELSTANGLTPDGAVVAYKLEDQGGKLKLTPAWVSPDVTNPSPASIVMNTAPETFAGFGAAAAQSTAPPPAVKAGGVVFVLAEGMAGKSNARLYGFDAETGAQVYSSGDQIKSSANQASVAISGGHMLFVTADNNLYSFGVEYERD